MDEEQLAVELVARARKAGADEADAILLRSSYVELLVRTGEMEPPVHSHSTRIGLRVFVGGRVGVASTTECRAEGLDPLVQTACTLAAAADKRSENRLPGPFAFIPRPELKLYDPGMQSLPLEQKIALAKRCEAAARATDRRVISSPGTRFRAGTTLRVLANSLGFVGSYRSSDGLIDCSVTAAVQDERQVGNERSVSHSLSGLEDAEEIGRAAAHGAVRMLGAHNVSTQKAAIVFDRRASFVLWTGVASALNGRYVAEGTSLFQNRMGARVAAESVTVVDDGTLLGGVGSAPFDGEGMPTRRTVLIENGILRSFFTDSATARKIGSVSTGNAARAIDGNVIPSARNLFLVAGKETPDEILRAVSTGFFVTDMQCEQGEGIHASNGEFAFRVRGLWFEAGKLTHPIQGAILAGSLADFLHRIERVGTDLIFNSTVVSPTFQVAPMTITGR